jgi:protein-disulfide isomerase
MTNEMSKRQRRREKMRRAEMRGRLFTIGLVTLGAILIALVFIYPNLKPVGAIQEITFHEYPDVDRNSMGRADAPVSLDMWSDFQCPACQNFSMETAPLLIENYISTGKVRFTYHFYPFIDDHSASNESDHSANAAMCAADQGRFWDMNDIIFANWNGENQGAFADRRLLAFAKSIGLEMDSFRSCFNDKTFDDFIQRDFQAGLEKGVKSTPSIFVNGKLVENAAGPKYVPGYDDIAAAIEAALAGK